MMAQIFSTGLSSIGVESGKWYILDRNSLESYGEFAMDSERMSNLADVFPMIFFLVAALSSLTTMTRMVEEHRTQIGSMKALGFSGRDIGIKYIGYALASSLGGGLAGWICGIFAIPGIIYYEWGLEYLLSPVKFLFSPAVLAYSVGFAVLATAGAAAAACQTTLSASAASLMRPRAPKPSKTGEKSSAGKNPANLVEAFFHSESECEKSLQVQTKVPYDGRRHRGMHSSCGDWAGASRFDL